MVEEDHSVYYSSFDIRPDHLFDGAAQRLTIFVCSPHPNCRYTEKQLRWYTIYRPYLFKTITYYKVLETYNYFYRSNSIGCDIINKIRDSKATKILDGCDSAFWVATTANNFIKAFDKQPYYFTNGVKSEPSGWRCLKTSAKLLPASVVILNSSVFYYLWKSSSDGFNLTTKFINKILPYLISQDMELQELFEDEINSLEKHSESHIRNQKTTGRTEIQLFRVKPVKTQIDDVDKFLAKWYGFTEEELDFIINYDIKYRMGDELNEDN